MPISGKLKTELSIQSVLERCSEYEIFHHFMPDKTWELNVPNLSPFRVEKNPSFVIGNKNGYLSYIDWGKSEFKGDCFNFVKQLHNLPNLDSVLRLIDKELNLGIVEGNDFRSKPISPVIEPEVQKRNTLIQVVTRKFTKEELAYWASYYQDINNLRQNNVFSIKKLYLNKKLFPLKENELRFGYFYPSTSTWKIYFPFKEKRKKWMGNVALSETYGKERLNKDKNTLICKSLKDFLVCIKVYEHCIQVQNESLAAFSNETIEYIKNNSRSVYYGGDSDVAGKKASYQITKTLGYKHINPPDYLLDNCCKDFADMAKIRGLEEVKFHFSKKGLID